MGLGNNEYTAMVCRSWINQRCLKSEHLLYCSSVQGPAAAKRAGSFRKDPGTCPYTHDSTRSKICQSERLRPNICEVDVDRHFETLALLIVTLSSVDPIGFSRLTTRDRRSSDHIREREQYIA